MKQKYSSCTSCKWLGRYGCNNPKNHQPYWAYPPYSGCSNHEEKEISNWETEELERVLINNETSYLLIEDAKTSYSTLEGFTHFLKTYFGRPEILLIVNWDALAESLAEGAFD